MKKLISALLILSLLSAGSALAAKTRAQAYRGSAMPDFSVQTISGENFTLSEVLKSHKAVIITFWASWCGGCETEFPYIQEAFEACGEDVAFIALSVEKTDDIDVMTAYAEGLNLTLPIASDAETCLGKIYATAGVPVNIAVDRFGNIALLEAGSCPSAESMLMLCERLCADDYAETVIIDGYPEAESTLRRDNHDCINPDYN